MFVTLIIHAAFLWSEIPVLPDVIVTSDDTVITRSCRIVIPPDTVIEDRNGNGVIQIGASDILVEFTQGTVLRGAPIHRPPSEYRGYGIRVDHHEDVTIIGGRISGFWGGLWASDANDLYLDSVDLSDNRRAHLKSTPAAEDGSDWLYPHNNDGNEWLINYGSAIYVEDSNNLIVRHCKVWHGQNALCLDRVDNAKIYDNDFSFNSGWGIALWRSNHNIITRNACDFCVRGYSHDVYNRGQDSAGILMFEQNCDNLIAENSATHSGDGFFGFAGREALGDVGSHAPAWYEKRGNSRNRLIKNDFSYAPAHGIEMTFSFGNIFYGNRLVENAICGVWGGYSQDTLIANNHFAGNGGMAYGLERGGVNIEHGQNNRIVNNLFKANKCGVHLWWDPEGDFAQKPWAQANGTASKDNLICANEFDGDACALHFRGPSEVTVGQNDLHQVDTRMEKDKDVKVHERSDQVRTDVQAPAYPVLGRTRPISARAHLRGRQNIIMTEWGPWDHASPLARVIQDTGQSVEYELRKMPRTPVVTVEGHGIKGLRSQPPHPGLPTTYTISAIRPGVYPYQVQVKAGGFSETFTGTLISVAWDVTFFKWTQATDPREHLDAWRKLASGSTAISTQVSRLSFLYGGGGPSAQPSLTSLDAAHLGSNHFGMMARTRLALSAGTWSVSTLSDDGIRVTVDGDPVIDNWTWHGPTRNTGELTLDRDKTVEIKVEYFEIDGHAVLDLEITPK